MSHEWKNVQLVPSSTILDALDILDKEALRVVLVINDKGCLIGVVTDGDIRRGLLNKPLNNLCTNLNLTLKA